MRGWLQERLWMWRTLVSALDAGGTASEPARSAAAAAQRGGPSRALPIFAALLAVVASAAACGGSDKPPARTDDDDDDQQTTTAGQGGAGGQDGDGGQGGEAGGQGGAGGSAPAVCGDGVRSGAEVCDGADLGGASCQALGQDGGALKCAPDCLSFDESACTCEPACDGLQCGPDPKCGVSCGSCDVLASCEAGQCVAGCLGPLDADTSLTLDLKTLTLTATVTFNGAPMPNDSILDGKQRGRLRFVNAQPGAASPLQMPSTVIVNFGETGPVNVSVPMLAGTYNVFLETSPVGEQSALPPTNNPIPLIKGLVLTSSISQTFDLKTVKLSGELSLNGAQMPDDGILDGEERGNLMIRHADLKGHISVFEAPHYASVGETGPATFSVTVFAGAYDVFFGSAGSGNQSVLPSAQTVLLAKGFDLTSSKVQSFDLKTVMLTSEVTLNGAPMPDDPKIDIFSRGDLQFINSGTRVTSVELDYGEIGPVSFGLPMFAGTYDVISRPASEWVLPFPYQRLAKALPLTSSMTKNFDIKTVTISGNVSMNGAALPDDPIIDGNSRGKLHFTATDAPKDEDGSGLYTFSVDLGETGPASYNVTLYADTYNVVVDWNAAGSSPSVGSNQQRAVLYNGLALTSSGVQNFDLKTVKLTGEVTLNGAPMPDDAKLDGYSRGWITFVRSAEPYSFQSPTIGFGETGPVAFSIELLADTYDVYAQSQYIGGQSILPDHRSTRVIKGLDLSASTSTVIDLKTFTLSGEVTLNGAPMPDDGALNNNARAGLRAINVHTGDDWNTSLGEKGPATFSIPLFSGTHELLLFTGAAAAQNVLPPSQSTQLLLGCPD